jgi:uncharacterized protein (DUF488 family)
LRSLGDPKDGREAARRGDFRTFERIYRRHLKTSGAEAGLDSVIATAEAYRICLMCFERDPSTCHRNIVVEEMSKRRQFSVEHLNVPSGIVAQGNDAKAKKRTAWSGESGHPG